MQGNTALHLAAVNGRLAAAQALVEAGAAKVRSGLRMMRCGLPRSSLISHICWVCPASGRGCLVRVQDAANKEGKRPADVAKTDELRALLS